MPAPSTLRQVRLARLPAPGAELGVHPVTHRVERHAPSPVPEHRVEYRAGLLGQCRGDAEVLRRGARPEQVPCAFHSCGAMIETSDIIDCRSVCTVCGRFSDGRLPSRCPLGRPQNCSVDGCGHRPCRIRVGPSLPTCPLRQPALDRSTVHRLGPHVTTSRLEVLFASRVGGALSRAILDEQAEDDGRGDHHAECGGNRQYGCVTSPHDALFSTTLSGGPSTSSGIVQLFTARAPRCRFVGGKVAPSCRRPNPSTTSTAGSSARPAPDPAGLALPQPAHRPNVRRYLRYRLRIRCCSSTFRFAVHVAEFFLMLSSLGGTAALTVMVLRAGSLFVAGGWWGLLEIMRERLRDFAFAGQRDASENEIGRWLVLAAVLAVLTVAAGAVGSGVPAPPDTEPVARLYAFLIIIEFAIDLPVRVLHSGIYATRRVYRPPLVDVRPDRGPAGHARIRLLPLPHRRDHRRDHRVQRPGIWITVHYCLEVYRLMGLGPPLVAEGRALLAPPSKRPVRAWVSRRRSPGLSLRLDAILVLALAGIYGTNTRTFDLTAGLTSWQRIDAFQFFYLILPLFRGTYESAGSSTSISSACAARPDPRIPLTVLPQAAVDRTAGFALTSGYWPPHWDCSCSTTSGQFPARAHPDFRGAQPDRRSTRSASSPKDASEPTSRPWRSCSSCCGWCG